MGKINGFTLLEVIFVLGILSTLLLLVAPVHLTMLEKEKEKRFLETFEFDLLYAQALATTTSDIIEVYFRENKYDISQKGDSGNGKVIRSRSIPSDWEIDINTIKIISFYDTGTIKKPGNMRIRAKTKTYVVVFPLGKGRAYVRE